MEETEKQAASLDAADVETQQSELLHSGRRPDVAAAFLATLSPDIAQEPITPEESRKLLWKIDLVLIPLLAISVIIAAVDKVIISNAALYGMKTDTKLVGQQYSWGEFALPLSRFLLGFPAY